MSFLFDKIIFGPVKSRRLGNSLGINLLPTEIKLCNFDCIYCECGFSDREFFLEKEIPSLKEISQHLENQLKISTSRSEILDTITFAGNGEPTLHPQFSEIIVETIRLRNIYFPKTPISVLTNGTTVHKPLIFNALRSVENPVLKLDSAFEITRNRINRPKFRMDTEMLVENFSAFDGNFILQTLFLKGKMNHQVVDNTTDNEVFEWLKIVEKLKPRCVMIYTIARETPVEDLQKINIEILQKIAFEVEKLGIKTQISG